ncbi:MAG: hypothetical protein HC908_01020 [Calothrix sp. SM1_7_51]|nr:hypothetical protein [Calothrix sp. SM1_7_51]
MTWRGTTTIPDRLFACLPYLLPLFGAIRFGYISGLIDLLGLQWLYFVVAPVIFVYSILGNYASLIIFFALFLLVVRNEKINHFIRYNTMQALLLDIILYLCGLVLPVVGLLGAAAKMLLSTTLASTIFLGIFVAIVYSVAQSLMGRYAEIPTISEAVYAQVR